MKIYFHSELLHTLRPQTIIHFFEDVSDKLLDPKLNIVAVKVDDIENLPLMESTVILFNDFTSGEKYRWTSRTSKTCASGNRSLLKLAPRGITQS